MTKIYPKVSIVCAWYNRADYIRDTVDSLLAQDYPNFDITLVNDGSPDPRVREILDAYDDPRLRVINHDNTGFTRAIRRAIDETNSEYIAIQGAGDKSHPARLSLQVAAISKSGDISAVGTGCVQVSAARNFRRRYFRPDADCTKTSLCTKMPFVHGTALFRRKLYLETGGYDVRFQYCSDWDLFFRLVDIGKIVGIDQPLYEQRMFADGFSFSPQHKFKQLWYRERATNRTPESRKLLDDAEITTKSIDPNNPIYFRYSVLAASKALAKGDLANSKQWIQLAIKQKFGQVEKLRR